MENSNDLNLNRTDLIQDGVRKTSNNCTSQVLVNEREQVGVIDYSGDCIINTLHELQIQIFAFVRIPFAGLGEFGIRVRGEPKNHVLSTRFHEFSFDLVPSAALAWIVPDPFESSIKFPLLGVSQLKRLILFGNCVPDFLH